MIVFETKRNALYNEIIHELLQIELKVGLEFRTDEMADTMEEIVPKYLRREQYQKCMETIEELFYWTNDKFNYKMTFFHEYILFKFFEYLDHKYKNAFADMIRKKWHVEVVVRKFMR